MNITTSRPHTPCRQAAPAADPWPFDLSKIDTCEEAMFAPGADMLVKALVGEEQPAHVVFQCAGQKMDYVQDAQGVRGTINGVDFHIERQPNGNNAHFLGDTPAGPMDAASSQSAGKYNIQGLAGTVQYNHDMYPGEPDSGILAEVQGKFG